MKWKSLYGGFQIEFTSVEWISVQAALIYVIGIIKNV